MKRYIQPWVRIANPTSLLDYGAGQSRLIDALSAPALTQRHRYDPAIADLSTIPSSSYDLVTCIDVMEHLEPDEVTGVVAHIGALSRRALFIIDTKPARAILPDGRNAHTTLRPRTWWDERLRAVFPEVERIPVSRKGREGFKTWTSGRREWLAFWALLASMTARHRLWRLSGGRYQIDESGQ